MTEEIDLVSLVMKVDSELIKEGVQPFQRPTVAYQRISQQLQPGSSCILKFDPLFNAVHQIYKDLYLHSDLHMPPMHVGAFMFRDVFLPVRIPIIYGNPAVNPVDFLTGVSEIRKRWIFAERLSGLTFYDQCIDLIDFVYGLDDLKGTGRVPQKTLEWWCLAKQQLEAAAATLLGSFDKYAVVQNCCLSIEQLLKGALMAKGINEKTLASKKQGYGHNLANLVENTAQLLPTFDRETVLFVVEKLPDYVESRYEDKKFSRIDLGNFLMSAQFISGEILRQFSSRNVRLEFNSTLDSTWNFTCRTFPQRPK